MKHTKPSLYLFSQASKFISYINGQHEFQVF